MTLDRYERQIRLPEIGQSGQDKLKNGSVLCVGAGGLGSPALLYLAAAGVGRIGIIDFDRVDKSNLQRQVLFDTAAVGAPKVSQVAQRLHALNPTIEIEIYNEELNDQNAAILFSSYDMIIDGTDNFETKFLINDAAVKFGKPWIYGAIQGFDGQASVFNYHGGPCYRCLYPEKPKGHVLNCAEAGVIGAVAGMIGVTQALQAIQIIIGHESFSPLSGKLMSLDTRTMNMRVLKFEKRINCKVCGENVNEIPLSYASPVCHFVPEISANQMKSRANYILIDVREKEEWNQGYIQGAQSWPLSMIAQGKFPDVPHNAEIILYCQRGMRSLHAAQDMRNNGFTDVYSLSGGYESWMKKS